METGSALASLLETALQRSLGANYEVSREVGSGQFRGDLLVRHLEDPKQVYVVELKMLNGGVDLPLTVANQTRRTIAENHALNPTLILATTSRVGNLLRQELAAQNVAIVQAEQPSQLSAGIAQVIRANS